MTLMRPIRGDRERKGGALAPPGEATLREGLQPLKPVPATSDNRNGLQRLKPRVTETSFGGAEAPPFPTPTENHSPLPRGEGRGPDALHRGAGRVRGLSGATEESSSTTVILSAAKNLAVAIRLIGAKAPSLCLLRAIRNSSRAMLKTAAAPQGDVTHGPSRYRHHRLKPQGAEDRARVRTSGERQQAAALQSACGAHGYTKLDGWPDDPMAMWLD